MISITDLVDEGKSLMSSGQFVKALVVFERALDADKSDPDLWNHVGTALRSLGRYDESVKYFEESLRLDPRDLNSS